MSVTPFEAMGMGLGRRQIPCPHDCDVALQSNMLLKQGHMVFNEYPMHDMEPNRLLGPVFDAFIAVRRIVKKETYAIQRVSCRYFFEKRLCLLLLQFQLNEDQLSSEESVETNPIGTALQCICNSACQSVGWH